MSRFTAVLVHGTTYYLGDVPFKNGQPREIDADQKEWLERYAVDVRSTDGEHVRVCKFEFTEIDEPKPEDTETEAEAEEIAPEAKPAKRRR